MSLERRASYMLLPAVIWWFGKGALEHVSAGKVARKQYASNARRSGPADRYAPLGIPFPPHARRAPSFLARRRFKWNEMANCGDAYVFFDPLGSSESMLASDSQSLALYNEYQEVVSKGGLDRFVRPAHPSIALTFNTLGVNNETHQLSRGSKPLNSHRYITGKTLMITSNFCQ